MSRSAILSSTLSQQDKALEAARSSRVVPQKGAPSEPTFPDIVAYGRDHSDPGVGFRSSPRGSAGLDSMCSLRAASPRPTPRQGAPATSSTAPPPAPTRPTSGREPVRPRMVSPRPLSAPGARPAQHRYLSPRSSPGGTVPPLGASPRRSPRGNGDSLQAASGWVMQQQQLQQVAQAAQAVAAAQQAAQAAQRVAQAVTVWAVQQQQTAQTAQPAEQAVALGTADQHQHQAIQTNVAPQQQAALAVLERAASESCRNKFAKSIGIENDEIEMFGWIADYGLQPETLGHRWTLCQDNVSGNFYYVDKFTDSCSWDNPFASSLRSVLGIARMYLRRPSRSFLEESKEALWHQHKQGCQVWHCHEHHDGSCFFTNAASGETSWIDPRQDAQYAHDLECILLDTFADALAPNLPLSEESRQERPKFGGTGTPRLEPCEASLPQLQNITVQGRMQRAADWLYECRVREVEEQRVMIAKRRNTRDCRLSPFAVAEQARKWANLGPNAYHSQEFIPENAAKNLADVQLRGFTHATTPQDNMGRLAATSQVSMDLTEEAKQEILEQAKRSLLTASFDGRLTNSNAFKKAAFKRDATAVVATARMIKASGVVRETVSQAASEPLIQHGEVLNPAMGSEVANANSDLNGSMVGCHSDPTPPPTSRLPADDHGDGVAVDVVTGASGETSVSQKILASRAEATTPQVVVAVLKIPNIGDSLPSADEGILDAPGVSSDAFVETPKLAQCPPIMESLCLVLPDSGRNRKNSTDAPELKGTRAVHIPKLPLLVANPSSVEVSAEIEKQPATGQLLMQQSAMELAVDQLVVKEFAGEQFVIEGPVVEQPRLEKHMVRQPAVEQPALEQPVVKQPVVEQLVVEQLVAKPLVVEQSAVEQGLVKQPLVEQLVVEHPVGKQPAVEQPAALLNLGDDSSKGQGQLRRLAPKVSFRELFAGRRIDSPPQDSASVSQSSMGDLEEHYVQNSHLPVTPRKDTCSALSSASANIPSYITAADFSSGSGDKAPKQLPTVLSLSPSSSATTSKRAVLTDAASVSSSASTSSPAGSGGAAITALRQVRNSDKSAAQPVSSTLPRKSFRQLLAERQAKA